MQGLIDEINRQSKLKEAKEYNLGRFIKDLEKYRESLIEIIFDDGSSPVDFGSWRGVYNCLALEYDKNKNYAETIYRKAYNTNNSIFVGYKGGDFIMDEDTPIYQANYGESGVDIIKNGKEEYVYKKIIGIKEQDGKVVIVTREEE